MNDKFVYTRPNGVRVIIEPFDIRKLLQLRYFEQRKWYSQHPTIPPELPTICEFFNIPKSRLDEIRESIEYREMCLMFLKDMGINVRSDIFEYSLHKTLGVKKPKNENYYQTKINIGDYEFDIKRQDIGSILSGYENHIYGDNKKITKIDKYRKERECDFKGITKSGLITRVKDMMDSRDYWKNKYEEQEDRSTHLRSQLESLVLKISNLESENTQLRTKINRDISSFNSGANELQLVVSELPKEIRKIVRNKFMIAAHPDKIGDSMNNLSAEEKQKVNRFFDFFQKLLKRN